ncbi:MAG: ABC transporter ATP-binding protein [Chloroflexi bacterium]|nr:ABC transporter ATP-binding protein [Chloroflexota bacterium]MBV9601083.1 ABC transporter ATP-binding protein [Chloroflexota bacterium]
MQQLCAGYGQRRVLQDLDLSIDPSEVVAILGANGAGKTTTLRAISGTTKREGQLTFDGQSLLGSSPSSTARLGIAHVPEGRGTMGQLTVLENLQLGAYIRRDRAVAADLERVYSYFPILRERRKQLAATLSGGEQQMLAIGRALMARPRLLLLDEPSLGLAPIVAQGIFDIITSINRDSGAAVLLVEQNAVAALDISHRAYVLEVGRIAVSGSSAELKEHAGVRRSYLGY